MMNKTQELLKKFDEMVLEGESPRDIVLSRKVAKKFLIEVITIVRKDEREKMRNMLKDTFRQVGATNFGVTQVMCITENNIDDLINSLSEKEEDK